MVRHGGTSILSIKGWAVATCLALLVCLAYVIMLECMLRQNEDNALDLPAYVRRRTLVDLVRR